MYLTLTIPLTIRHLVSCKTYQMLPVPMAQSTPSTDPTLWRKFLKVGGRVLPISKEDTARVRQYMQQHQTEALSVDGEVAYTLNGEFLAECMPQACGVPDSLAIEAL